MKLTTLKPVLATRREYRDRVEPGRQWYKTNEWQRLRTEVFVRDHYTCQWEGCGRIEANTRRLIAHHKKAHKGNRDLFFDIDNLITVCKACHDGPIASLERSSSLAGTWD